MTRPATQDEIADRGRDLQKHEPRYGEPSYTALYLSEGPPLAINGVRLFVTGGFPMPEEPARHQFKPLSPSFSSQPSPLVYPAPLQDQPLETPAPASSED